jgi:type II secretory pathway component PulL
VPRRVRVIEDAGGLPTAVGGRAVVQVCDQWRVDEGWWSGHRTSRTYFELVLEGGANAVVFLERGTGAWYGHRA